jgi:putative SOS response-associated peptidase YedK
MSAAARHPLSRDPDAILAERGRSIMVVRRHPVSGELVQDKLTWGLIPHGSPTRPDIASANARAETIAEKAVFRDAYKKRRAVVPIDAFEQKDNRGKRHTICRADGEPMAVAAIWENWRDPRTGNWERTFATLTIAANETLAPIHDRMPLILEKRDLARWLGAEEDPHDLLKASADDVLVVSPKNGKPTRRS